MKHGYFTMTRPRDKATINGVAVYRLTCPKKFQVKKSTGKFLASIFWDQDGIHPIDYLPKVQTINAECYSFLLVELKDI
jgi:hypothetical protein